MTTIQAIETAYRGYRFRSRLEARWAVFFDALGMQWQYEPEGFELPSGRYLPDFKLVGAGSLGMHDQWVEVKGVPSHAEFIRLLRAAVELPYEPWRSVRPGVLLLGDVPEPGDPIVHSRVAAVGDLPVVQNVFFDQHAPAGFVVTPVGEAVGFPLVGIDRLDEKATAEYRGNWTSPLCEFRLRHDVRVSEAHAAARSARFEHGESGAPNNHLPGERRETAS